MRAVLAAVAIVVLASSCGSDASGVRSNGTDQTQSATFEVAPGATPELIDQTAQVMQRRFDALGVDHVSINVHGNQITVELPAGDVANHALKAAARPGDLEFRPVLGTRDPGAAFVGRPEQESFLPNEGGSQVFDAGPVAVLGDAVDRATPEKTADGQWTVALVLSQAGIDAFNGIAEKCFAKSSQCPTGRLAVVVEGIVESAPTIQVDHYERDQIQVSGSFSEVEAKDLAAVFQAGALPAQVVRVDG